MIKIEAFCTKNEDFDQTYVNTGSKNSKSGRVKPWPGKISKVSVNKTQS